MNSNIIICFRKNKDIFSENNLFIFPNIQRKYMSYRNINIIFIQLTCN